jgi:hypothetical protein
MQNILAPVEHRIAILSPAFLIRDADLELVPVTYKLRTKGDFLALGIPTHINSL